ncbi:TPA: cadherin repeat domain-containing protein [Candidatus Woesearchaeota archaeon]|nr:cadherin repeat domain-containing protein [Candidatus Woesearchaeota archaeon]HIH31767.1 cadherin repeat domain-containing protein [Candidatus Woesearchaeota archaeon]HIH54672.1 cadherin repeat domain-containing protein [Candidatus Woesearchaeota archaeon]HIJ01559.1 cadherin repeat domain-containing protein [Candidatus Woesearchaeota archaeon]HIJ13962.1 cadherin repeat domain-containing protein [Candidatus Woesearchaeota archaeon]
MKDNIVLGMAVIGLLALNIVTIVYLQYSIQKFTSEEQVTALASGTTMLCLNNPPIDIYEGSCNLTMIWGNRITCQINATDPDNNSMSYAAVFLTDPSLFNVSSIGIINVILDESNIGNHTLRVFAFDDSTCENNAYYEDINIEVIDDNHAPYLIRNIPDQSLRKNNAYTLFLNNYFGDPDNDELTYEALIFNESYISITISNSSLTTIRGLECGLAYFNIIASDPDGLINVSNLVRYSVFGCPLSDSGGSGGGGGGGSSGIDLSCISDWRCSAWGECMPNGTQMLTCRDYKACSYRDYIRNFTRNCTYVPETIICEEKWECSEWSTCINNTHLRTCIDRNSCGTKIAKPNETESCTPIPSCFNGIKDGDETEVDCGGKCGACKVTEQPAQVGINRNLIIAAIISTLAVIIIIIVITPHIKKIIAAYLAKKRLNEMPLYLNNEQKQMILNLMLNIQDLYDDDKHSDAIAKMPQVIKIFFENLVGTDKEVPKSIRKLNNRLLESILIDFHQSTIKTNIKSYLQAFIDKFIAHLFLVAKLNGKDALILPKERENPDAKSIDKIFLELSNIYIALQFHELPEAKYLYKNLLKEYNTFEKEDQKQCYNEILHVYNVIKYLEKYY